MTDDTKELLKQFEPKESNILQKTSGAEFTSARFSPCGKFLVGAGFDGKVWRWNVSGDDSKELAPIAGHNGWVQEVACDRQGLFVYSADSWGQLRCTPLAEENPQPKW